MLTLPCMGVRGPQAHVTEEMRLAITGGDPLRRDAPAGQERLQRL